LPVVEDEKVLAMVACLSNSYSSKTTIISSRESNNSGIF
jgi:hypothetical protein